eukprot:g24636.t1
MGAKGEVRVKEERGKTGQQAKRERQGRQDPPAKEAVHGVGWVGRRKESHRPRTDDVKQAFQQLGERRRNRDGGKKTQGNTVAEMAKIIDDVEKIDQTLDRMAKRVSELQREESAKAAERQQRQREGAKEPKRKSILKHDAQVKSIPPPPTKEEKQEETGQGAPQEQVETVVSIVVEAVHKVVDEVMHNVIEKMVTDEKMMMQDDHMAADVVEKLGQMMKGDGDKQRARPTVRERLLQAKKEEEQKMERVTSLTGPGLTSFVEPHSTGSKGAELTGYKNGDVTSHQGDEVTSFHGDDVTSFLGDDVTSF